ncbi:MAG: ribbon-helix-helix protein, CopG family [Nitrospirae bacterium]|nr:ribbon-helix-helix protein, CopG family [Nitrospirota bacterium]
MAVKKLGISFPEDLIPEIDMLSKALSKTRSEVIRDAIKKMIDDYRKQQSIAKAETIYKEIASEDKRLADDFLSICAEPVTAYKAAGKTKKYETPKKR